jgi:large subunit ribosomal protein L21
MYAIISLQGKQYRVEEGQRLIVDRLAQPADKPFHPAVLFVGGDGKAEFSPKGAQVTAKVVQDVLGDKIRIGKYKPKSGIRRHTGHRSKLTEIEITAIGLKAAPKKAAEKPAAEKPAAEEAKPKAEKKPAAKPKAAAPKKAPARKTSAKTTKEDE